jgi:hypothetical protein
MSMEDLIRSLFTNGDGVDRGEAIRAHREMFKGTSFSCQCGGDVYPFSPTQGLCRSCKEEPNLADLEYETEGESEEGEE